VGQPNSDAGVNLLIVAQGDVVLKRQSWGDYFLTEVGSQLRRGDLIRITGDGQAVVLCDGLTTWAVSPGAPAGLNNGCPPPPESLLQRGTSLVGNTRGAIDPAIPYIILPRKTGLLSPTPRLRWHAVEGASAYTVTLRGGGIDWQTTTRDTEITYPGTPALTPGESYALIVETAEGASSRDESTPGLGFTLLHKAEAAAIRRAVDRIEGLGLTPEAQTLALVQLYDGQGLLAEAITALEGLADQELSSATVYRNLGDLYRQIGLNDMAGGYYQTAIDKATAANNLEIQAAAQEGLAEVMLAHGKGDEAIALLQAAVTGYQTLGDASHAEIIQARIAAIRP
jgi:hypothetical protein